MGLDMYLYGDVYAGQYLGRENYERIKRVEFNHPWPVDPESFTVRATLAYWRKANAIHNWFVQNCQDGKDECQVSYVSVEQLKELSDICTQLLASRDEDEARDLLPPQSGFFFGGTEIDEHYWTDLEETVRQLNRIITSEMARNDELAFHYQSSW